MRSKSGLPKETDKISAEEPGAKHRNRQVIQEQCEVAPVGNDVLVLDENGSFSLANIIRGTLDDSEITVVFYHTCRKQQVNPDCVLRVEEWLTPGRAVLVKSSKDGSNWDYEEATLVSMVDGALGDDAGYVKVKVGSAYKRLSKKQVSISSERIEQAKAKRRTLKYLWPSFIVLLAVAIIVPTSICAGLISKELSPLLLRMTALGTLVVIVPVYGLLCSNSSY